MSCLSADAALAFAEGRLALEQRVPLERHVDEGATCGLLVAELAGLVFEISGAPTARGSQHLAQLLTPGTRVGRQVITRVLGAGGGGIVYAAFDPELARKTTLSSCSPGPDASGNTTKDHASPVASLPRVCGGQAAVRLSAVPNASAELALRTPPAPDPVREGLDLQLRATATSPADDDEWTVGVLVHLEFPRVIGCHVVADGPRRLVRLEAFTRAGEPSHPFQDWSEFPWRPISASPSERYRVRLTIGPMRTDGEATVRCSAWPDEGPHALPGWELMASISIAGRGRPVSLRAYRTAARFDGLALTAAPPE